MFGISEIPVVHRASKIVRPHLDHKISRCCDCNECTSTSFNSRYSRMKIYRKSYFSACDLCWTRRKKLET